MADTKRPIINVPLPSKGLLYPEGHPFSDQESIEVKAFCTREEEIVNNVNLLRAGKAFDVLISSVLLDTSIKVEDLLIGDKNSIIINLRTSGYSRDYNIETLCRFCNNRFKHKFDLGNLNMKPLGQEPIEKFVNEFEAEIGNHIYKFQLPTVKIENEVNLIRKRKKNIQHDSSISDRLQLLIKSVDGEGDRIFIADHIQTITSLPLRRYINDISPDIIMKNEVTCPGCNEIYDCNIPITEQFFWPDRSF